MTPAKGPVPRRPPVTKTKPDMRATCIEIATEFLHHKGQCDYSMAANRWLWHNHTTLTFPFVSDCSGTCTCIDYFAGCGDPSGVNFAYGDTLTMMNHAYANKLIITKAQLLHGDWIFFGPARPGQKPDHVVMAMQDGATHKDPQCFSMGREGDPSMVLLSVLSGIGAPTFVRNVTRHR